jgi:S1-C subfamily serine protease
MKLLSLLAVSALAACAAVPSAPHESSPVPGTLGILVQQAPAGVMVSEVGEGTPAAAAGLRAGDLILRYNGQAVDGTRDLYRRMLESAPGSLAEVEVLRGGQRRRIRVRVEEADTVPRG